MAKKFYYHQLELINNNTTKNTPPNRQGISSKPVIDDVFSNNNIPQNNQKFNDGISTNNNMQNNVEKSTNKSYNIPNNVESGDIYGESNNGRAKGTDTFVSERGNTENINKEIEPSNGENTGRVSVNRFGNRDIVQENQNKQGTYRIHKETVNGTTKKRVKITENNIKKEISNSNNNKPVMVARISPNSFLKLTANDKTTKSFQKDLKTANNEKLDINKLNSSGKDITLTVNMKTGEVLEHDGRHRMLNMLNSGVSTADIKIIPATGTYDNQDIKNRNVFQLSPQKDIASSEEKFNVSDLMPLTKENESNIRNMYLAEDAPENNKRNLNVSFSNEVKQAIAPIKEENKILKKEIKGLKKEVRTLKAPVEKMAKKEYNTNKLEGVYEREEQQTRGNRNERRTDIGGRDGKTEVVSSRYRVRKTFEENTKRERTKTYYEDFEQEINSKTIKELNKETPKYSKTDDIGFLKEVISMLKRVIHYTMSMF